MGACLSFGETWETAWLVTYNSMQLGAGERNYPIHEKELLAVVRALKKWHSDLLGSVYTDHCTLENFNTQCDLSRWQLRWQEFMSQYEMSIVYICREDNCVADTLSRVPENAFPDERSVTSAPPILHDAWRHHIGAILSITTDRSVLESIKEGYNSDDFCICLAQNNVPGAQLINDLWYIGDCLVIPRTGDVRKNLFRLAHDTLGHFGADKSYANLRDAYYWPNMRTDLEKSYIPSCSDCQCNKSHTTKPPGPLHPLPIPDKHGDSVALDFVGPLPEDDSYNCILTMTNHLGSDYRLIPTRTDTTAKDIAVLVFDNWYCENVLPSDFVSDWDKLFISRFWKALTRLTGVQLKMSSTYHLQTSGSSERTNKTINQAIRFHVNRNQKGWVRALPRIYFCMMNTINSSTGYSGFQLHLGRSPHVIPPIVPTSLPDNLHSAGSTAENIINQLTNDIADAKDNLIQAKAIQATYAKRLHGQEVVYQPGDKVMLSTFHRCWDFKQKGDDRAAKFFPRWDGPYTITKAHPETSSYTLDNNSPYPYYASKLKLYHQNNPMLFPNHELPKPGPVLTPDGMQEHKIEQILDMQPCGCGHRYLVWWVGYGPEDDEWLPGRMLKDCKALDQWIESGGNGTASGQ